MSKSFGKNLISFVLIFVMVFSVMPSNVFTIENEIFVIEEINSPFYGMMESVDLNEYFDISMLQSDTVFEGMAAESDFSNVFTDTVYGGIAAAQSQELGTQRYTVLVLDASHSSGFSVGGQTVFTANTALAYVKTAATRFVEQVRHADGDNYVAVVIYRGSTATTVMPFTTDTGLLRSSIASIQSSGTTRSVDAGLYRAYSLLTEIDNPNAIKNVVLFSTGMTNDGPHSYTGRYDFNTIGSSWIRLNTGIPLFSYANAAYEVARHIDSIANIYSVGLFQCFEGIPDSVYEIVQFFKLSALD